MSQPWSWAVKIFASTYLIRGIVIHFFCSSLTSCNFSQKNLRLLIVFVSQVLDQAILHGLRVPTFEHKHKLQANVRRCPALASSGTEFDCCGITGEFNRWCLVRQILQTLLSSASKSVFFSKTNRPKNYEFSFKKTVNVRTRLGSPCWPVKGYSAIIALFSLFLLSLLIRFISCWVFHNSIRYSRCKTLRYTLNVNIAHSFGKRWCSLLRFIGWRHGIADNRFNMRCESREFISRPKTQGLFFAWITSIQLN